MSHMIDKCQLWLQHLQFGHVNILWSMLFPDERTFFLHVESVGLCSVKNTLFRLFLIEHKPTDASSNTIMGNVVWSVKFI